MGEPTQGKAWVPHAEYIGMTEGTRGTETSQYLSGKERIPRVVASERGRA